MNPFQAHAEALIQIQTILGESAERTSGAVLQFDGMVGVACSHSPVIGDFDLGAGGKSSMTMVEVCEFLASDVGNKVLTKGDRCRLIVRPGSKPMRMQLWDGGLLPGGYIYRFRLVSENFKG